MSTHRLQLRLAAMVVTASICSNRPSSVLGAEIPMVERGGTYCVQGEINGQVKKLFVVDSGAAELSVPAEVVATLFPETLRPEDFLDGATYRLADGRSIQSDRFMIRTLQVGSLVFRNVPASVASPGAPLLLGQGVLGRLSTWSIDNRRHVLVLGDILDGSVAGPREPPPSKPDINTGSSSAPTLPTGIPFSIGTHRDQVRQALGAPNFQKDTGYWANTTVDRFDGAMPNWLTLAYLYDSKTLRVKQSEAVFYDWPGFDGWNGVEYLFSTIQRMSGLASLPQARDAVLTLSGGAPKATFKTSAVEGSLERQDTRRIYIAVWERGVHDHRSATRTYPFVGDWSGGPATCSDPFRFTATNYTPPGVASPLSMKRVAADGDWFTLDFPDGYRVTLADVKGDTLTWHSPQSGDTFDLRRCR